MQTDWNQTIQFRSLEALTSAVKTGQTPGGNITCVQSIDCCQRLRDLWESFAVETGLTVVLLGKARNLPQITHSRARIRCGKSDRVEPIGILKLGNQTQHPSPGPKPSVAVERNKIQIAERVSIRVIVPTHYRKFFVEAPDAENVSSILSALSVSSGVRTHSLTGGQWSWQQVANARQLCGWLRVTKDDAAKLLPRSGENSIFLSSSSKDPPSIFWHRGLENEDREQYFTRLYKLAKERGSPLYLRKGMGHDLGLEKQESDTLAARPRLLDLSGVPPAWQGEEIQSLLDSQGWCLWIAAHGIMMVVMSSKFSSTKRCAGSLKPIGLPRPQLPSENGTLRRLTGLDRPRSKPNLLNLLQLTTSPKRVPLR